jgi:proline iminopeptidase
VTVKLLVADAIGVGQRSYGPDAGEELPQIGGVSAAVDGPETCGNSAGKPALVVHGGPGSGCTPRHRRSFDPERYRVVLFDQRMCGRSRPLADDPSVDLGCNTTAHLVADIERLRTHLGIERWLLWGASWGSTLLLAYAERHPERVSEIVISGVTTTRQSEIDWLYRGLYRFFPEEWERFRAGAGRVDSDDELIAAYGRLMADPDAGVRAQAARDWSAWEDATISLDPGGNAGSYSARPPDLLLARARLCAHYFAHGAWLQEGQLLASAHRLHDIPGVLIQGRMDMGGFDTTWELARAWPDAELAVIDRSGHSGSASMTARQVAALDHFAAR